MQQELVAGFSLNFLTSVEAYPATDGWTLKFRLIPRNSSNTPIELTAAAEGSDYRTTAAPAITAGWAADTYAWVSWVEKAGEEYPVQTGGEILVKPNSRTIAAGYDGRSQARKALEDAKAALAAWTPTQRRYKIGEREMEFADPAAIIKLITWWERQVLAEDVLAGRVEKPSRRIYSRI